MGDAVRLAPQRGGEQYICSSAEHSASSDGGIYLHCSAATILKMFATHFGRLILGYTTAAVAACSFFSGHALPCIFLCFTRSQGSSLAENNMYVRLCECTYKYVDVVNDMELVSARYC